MALQMPPKFGKSQSVKGIICMESFEGKFRKDLHLPWSALELSPLKHLIINCFGWMASTGFILVAEIIFHKCAQWSKKADIRRIRGRRHHTPLSQDKQAVIRKQLSTPSDPAGEPKLSSPNHRSTCNRFKTE